ncbi:MAG: hypothetical protein HY587_06115 [Candidatus Omnitrophica bacterium]|nr:hypothetical protein [Candidatus Omnitrophota bacterium]
MIILAKSFGILIAVLGLIFLVYPDRAKKMMDFWKEGNRIYGAGAIRLAIGVILLFASPQAAQPFTAAVLGVLILVTGVVIFVMGLEEVKKQIAFWESQPILVRRIMGVFVTLFGILIISI